MKHIKLFEGFSSGQKIYYHGSARDFDSFDSSRSNYGKTIYFTESKPFALQFAQDRGIDGGFLYTVRLDLENPFDAFLKEHRESLVPLLRELVEAGYEDPQTGAKFYTRFIVLNGKSIENPSMEQSVQSLLWRLENGSWRILESQPIIDFIRSKGYDALVTMEKGQENVAVWDPSKIEIIKKENIKNILK